MCFFWGVDDYINTAQETGEYRRIEAHRIGDSIIDTRVDGNLKILQNLRKASMLCFLITMGGIIAIMNINISQMISERNHEIGIAYAVGYSANQITLELWAEIALLLAEALSCFYVCKYTV